MGEAYTTNRRNKNVYKILREPEGKPLAIPRLKWENNIKIYIKNRVRGYETDYSGTEYDPMDAVIKFRLP
jgi:hypothetical protein